MTAASHADARALYWTLGFAVLAVAASIGYLIWALVVPPLNALEALP